MVLEVPDMLVVFGSDVCHLLEGERKIDGPLLYSTCFCNLCSVVVGYCGVVILTGYRNHTNASRFEENRRKKT